MRFYVFEWYRTSPVGVPPAPGAYKLGEPKEGESEAWYINIDNMDGFRTFCSQFKAVQVIPPTTEGGDWHLYVSDKIQRGGAFGQR